MGSNGPGPNGPNGRFSQILVEKSKKMMYNIAYRGSGVWRLNSYATYE